MGNVSVLKSKLSTLRKLQSKHPLLFAHIADCYLKLGNFNAAKKVLKRGTAKYPDYPSGWVVEGEYHLLHNHPEKARKSFKKVIEIDPFNSYAHERCSEIAADFNDQNDYRFHIRAMSKLDPLSDNIQKMRQAEDLRQIAVNNGIFTLEEAENLAPNTLRHALLKHDLLPGEFKRSVDREISSVQFEEHEFAEESDDESGSFYEFKTTDGSVEETKTEEVVSHEDEMITADQIDETDQLISEETEESVEEEGTDWFDDSPAESFEPELETSPETQMEDESGLTNWAAEESEELIDESDTGIAWAQSSGEEIEEEVVEKALENDGGFGDQASDEFDMEDEEKLTIDEVLEAPQPEGDDAIGDYEGSSESEELEVPHTDEFIADVEDAATEQDAKPKTFAEYQTQQQSAYQNDDTDLQMEDEAAIASEISETDEKSQDFAIEPDDYSDSPDVTEPDSVDVVEDTQTGDLHDISDEADQPAKPVFDIQSLGITEDIADDLDDIFTDEAEVVPAVEEVIEESSEDMIQSLKPKAEEDVSSGIDAVSPVESTPETSDHDFSQESSEAADISLGDSVVDEMAPDQDQGLFDDPESVETKDEIPVLSGLEGASAIGAETDDPKSLSDSQVDAAVDQQSEDEKPISRRQPAIESALSQVIGDEEAVDDVDELDEQQLSPQPESESIKASPVGEEIKSQLRDIAAEVTGVEPITPESSEPVASEVPSAQVVPEPDPQKPKRIATKTLAELYASQGDWHRAINVYEELLGRHPENDAYKKRLEDLRSKLD